MSRLQTGQLKELGLDSCQIHEIFFTSKYSGWLWGLPSFLFSSYWGLFPRLSHQGMKLITHPSSSQVQNAWSDISTPLYAFMQWCLINHRDSFTFALLILYPTVHMILLYVDRWTDSCMMKIIGTYLCFVMNVLSTGCTISAEWACAVLW